MLRLTARDESRRNTIVTDLERQQALCDAAWSHVEDAVRGYNETVASFNEALQAAEAWRDDIEREQTEFFEARSDKWKEGEKGDAYSTWRTEFEDADFSSVEDFIVDAPGSELADRITALRDLPGEPDEV